MEAAKLGTPLIARDIPVFREVAGAHALYFSGLDPQSVADVVKHWLALAALEKVPLPGRLRTKTWEETTSDLLDAIFAETHRGYIHKVQI